MSTTSNENHTSTKPPTETRLAPEGVDEALYKRVEAEHAEWRRKMESEFNKIKAAEKLTAANFYVRINTRG